MESGAEQDERVMRIISRARRQLPAQRESYLRSTCETDSDLYREIAETLKWEDRMGNFLQEPLIARTVLGRPFQAGQIVSGRFEIVRVVGEGGMGIVYEAVDRKRNQQIAIKSAKPGFQRLLSPELEGALKVRHPNICLVNEIHTAPVEGGEVDFLTMEFLDGETLSAYLARNGKPSYRDALDIAHQLCAGLAEAHRSGIIHGDLKTGNIILCRNEDKSRRVVITDFGLASGANLQSHEGGGTPAYMAPELWRGEKPSKASDIYALGVILYETVTCRLPFEESPQGQHKTALQDPSALNKGLTPRWDRVILHCLDTVPSSRPLDAAEVINGLEKKFLRKESLLASALVISVFLAAASQVPMIHDWLADHLWPPPASVRLAVLPFEGLPEDIKLAGGGILQDVSDRVSHLRSGRRTVVVIPPVAAVDNHAQTPEQAKQVLSATHALQTTVHREANELIIVGAVIDLATQRHLRDFSRRYSAAAAGRIPVALTGEVSLALDLQGASAPELLSSAATAAYDQGLYFLRRDDESFGEAISGFEEAARLDPNSPLPLAGLVEAEIKRFGATKDERSIASAKRALHAAEELNPDSPRVRLASGVLNEATGQFGRALEDYRRVQSLEPRNIEALLRMANAYNRQNVPERALEAYQKAMELEPDYYEPYHALGVFYFYRGKYPQALEQFRKSIERAPRFEEYTNLGAVLDELGQDTEAEQALLTSVRLHRTGRALNSLGAMRAYQKRDAEAVEFYTGAIKEEPGQYVYFENLADSYRRLGRIGEAKKEYLKAFDLAELELNQNPNQGYPRSFVAYIAARLGDSKKARNEIEQALALSPEDNKVIRNAVLTYEFLRQRDRAIAVLKGATPDLLRELDRHPDLADFRKDIRFQQLIGKIRKEGYDYG